MNITLIKLPVYIKRGITDFIFTVERKGGQTSFISTDFRDHFPTVDALDSVIGYYIL